jgi:hypothetical protein
MLLWFIQKGLVPLRIKYKYIYVIHNLYFNHSDLF